jgi:hypothetical protein
MTLTTREAGAAFADVVYADQQWVDVEFDALISPGRHSPSLPWSHPCAQLAACFTSAVILASSALVSFFRA